MVLLATIQSACGQLVNEVNDALNTDAIIKEPPVLNVRSNNYNVVAVLGNYSRFACRTKIPRSLIVKQIGNQNKGYIFL